MWLDFLMPPPTTAALGKSQPSQDSQDSHGTTVRGIAAQMQRFAPDRSHVCSGAGFLLEEEICRIPFSLR